MRIASVWCSRLNAQHGRLAHARFFSVAQALERQREVTPGSKKPQHRYEVKKRTQKEKQPQSKGKRPSQSQSPDTTRRPTTIKTLKPNAEEERLPQGLLLQLKPHEKTNVRLTPFSAAHNIKISPKLSTVKDRKALNDFGYRMSYSLDHIFHPWDLDKFLLSEHALNDKYMAIYAKRKKEESLWIQCLDQAGASFKAVVRGYARAKCKRALIKAIEQSHYTTTGESCSEQTKGTKLQGTLRISVSDPIKTVNCKESQIAAHMQEVLRTRVIAQIRVGAVGSKIKVS